MSPAAGEFHNPDVRTCAYDIDHANAILDCLGWTDTDGDGIREDSAGNAIAFTMVTNSGNSTRSTIGTLIHQGMKQIGLDVDYQIIDFGDLVYRLTLSYDWEAVIIGLTGGSGQRLQRLAQQRASASVESQSNAAGDRLGSQNRRPVYPCKPGARLCTKSRKIIRTG